MKIQKLPPSVRSYIQSGIIITDAVQGVLELVRQSSLHFIHANLYWNLYLTCFSGLQCLGCQRNQNRS